MFDIGSRSQVVESGPGPICRYGHADPAGTCTLGPVAVVQAADAADPDLAMPDHGLFWRRRLPTTTARAVRCDGVSRCLDMGRECRVARTER